MDPLTHGILGATAALLRTKKPKSIKPAIVCGLMAGMFPDLDIVIRSMEDPLLSLKYHRHFTHAIAFVPLGALIVALFAWFALFSKEKFKDIYAFCFVAMLCHGLLDAMTSYGTHLLLPFDDQRIAWNVVSIIDPLFTVPILAFLIAAALKKNRLIALAGICWAVAYLSFGYVQQQKAITQLEETAKERGHSIAKMTTKPSLANLFVWRGQYIHRGNIYVDAYHISPWAGTVVYEGDSYPLFEPSKKFIKKIGLLQADDLEYFTFFSNGWVAEYPKGSSIISDMRYSNLPNGLAPLWGITFHEQAKNLHASRVSSRTRKEGDVQELWHMIQGKPLLEAKDERKSQSKN